MRRVFWSVLLCLTAIAATFVTVSAGSIGPTP